MKTLIERTDDTISRRRISLKEALEGKRLIGLLPDELQQLDGVADTGYAACILHLEYAALLNEGVDILKVCKMAGVQGLSPSMSPYGGWSATGEFSLPDDKLVRVGLSGIDKPVNCTVEEYEETVTKYRAICEETGAEITR